MFSLFNGYKTYISGGSLMLLAVAQAFLGLTGHEQYGLGLPEAAKLFMLGLATVGIGHKAEKILAK